MRDGTGKVVKRGVLVAYGITVQGRRELIARRLTEGGSEQGGTGFLPDLFLRGLQGRLLRLLVLDGSPGLRAALELVDPQGKIQRCGARQPRHIAAKVPPRAGPLGAGGSGDLAGRPPQPGRTSLAALGREGALLAAPSGGGGGRRPPRTVELLRGSVRPREEGPRPPREGARLPGCSPPPPSPDEFHKPG